MVAASGIPARHSKGMLLTLHDTRTCRENPGRTWMHKLCDGGMQKCMDEISRGWKQQKIGQPELWSEAWIGRRTKAGILESSSGDYRTQVWRLELSANAPYLQFQKSPRTQRSAHFGAFVLKDAVWRDSRSGGRSGEAFTNWLCQNNHWKCQNTRSKQHLSLCSFQC